MAQFKGVRCQGVEVLNPETESASVEQPTPSVSDNMLSEKKD
ncbi:MAG: hypothetical protein AB1Z31_03990 [Desulfobacterales bacterium]|jgi:hypothetical protein